MNIKDILMCPKCRSGLTEGLKCGVCNAEYGYKYGVYDIVSPELSGDAQIFWNISDEQIESAAPGAGKPDWAADYYAKMSAETKLAQRMQGDFMRRLTGGMSGTVCDLATGRGENLARLLESEAGDFDIVCTDIDPRILAVTRKARQTDDSRVFFAASDGRYMSFKDESFDFVTSVAAFGNIPESGKVARELHRVLKPRGKLIIEGTYIEKGSKSFELAESLGLEQGMVEQYLTAELRAAGFADIISTVVAQAVWAENPYDLLPVAGDMQYFCVIQATK